MLFNLSSQSLLLTCYFKPKLLLHGHFPFRKQVAVGTLIKGSGCFKKNNPPKGRVNVKLLGVPARTCSLWGRRESQVPGRHFVFYKKNTSRLNLCFLALAGVVGFEPTHDGFRDRCLTAWRYPNI